MNQRATEIAGVFVPLEADEQARLWKLLAAAGLPQDGRGIARYLLSKKEERRDSSVIGRALGFVADNPQLLRDAGDVARVVIGGGRQIRRFRRG